MSRRTGERRPGRAERHQLAFVPSYPSIDGARKRLSGFDKGA